MPETHKEEQMTKPKKTEGHFSWPLGKLSHGALPVALRELAPIAFSAALDERGMGKIQRKVSVDLDVLYCVGSDVVKIDEAFYRFERVRTPVQLFDIIYILTSPEHITESVLNAITLYVDSLPAEPAIIIDPYLKIHQENYLVRWLLEGWYGVEASVEDWKKHNAKQTGSEE